MDQALGKAEREIIGDIWTSQEAYDNLVIMCDDFGSRFGGTPSEKQAVDFMLGKLTEYGLDKPRVEPFAYNGWKRGSASLRMLEPRQASFDCIGLPYAPTAQVKGELVFVGEGSPEDYEKAKERIHGNIVMVSTKTPQFMRRTMHRLEKYGRALEAGAAAFIWMREEPGLLPETGSIKFNGEAKIPAVGVSKEVGASLLRQMKKGPVTMELATENVNEPMTSWNVMAEITGYAEPEKVIVVGAHFDGHDIAPGAMDDGSGAVVTMEAARALAQHKEHFPKTVRFILFPLEEMGLIGSHAYVDAHPEEMKNVEFMLNLDGAGRPGDSSVVLQGWKELIPVFGQLNDTMKESFSVRNRISPYSDMYPFVLEGVPAATIASESGGPRGARGWGHTAADTLDKVSPRGLQKDALLVARILLHLVNGLEHWPAAHKPKEEIKKLLDEEELLEVLKYEERYPFDQ